MGKKNYNNLKQPKNAMHYKSNSLNVPKKRKEISYEKDKEYQLFLKLFGYYINKQCTKNRQRSNSQNG